MSLSYGGCYTHGRTQHNNCHYLSCFHSVIFLFISFVNVTIHLPVYAFGVHE